jgi:hypothetical protein
LIKIEGPQHCCAPITQAQKSQAAYPLVRWNSRMKLTNACTASGVTAL